MIKEYTQPARLEKGDSVAIISPSSGCASLFPWVYELGIKRIKEVFGLNPIEFPTALATPDYLARNPKARAQDINDAFADTRIKAIIATTGGLDQIRILPFLDMQCIQQNPKIFLGYSDNTNLHLVLHHLGIISYYGGSVMSQFAMQGAMHEYTINTLRAALFQEYIGKFECPESYTDQDFDWDNTKLLTLERPRVPTIPWEWHNISHSIIQGRLWGGCLEILTMHLSLKTYIPTLEEFSNIVLYIETSEEMPPAGDVYRFFAVLGELGILQRLRAILVAIPKAQFLTMVPPEGKEAFIGNQKQAVLQVLHDYNIQVLTVFNLNFGHTDPQSILPSGGVVTLDCNNKTIKFI